ncbi:ATP synthase F0 subunit A, partial [Flavobacteriaceae bacterium]|nr:ATP synthase F0 subunit A [Flavobacteriaceae bacterium]
MQKNTLVKLLSILLLATTFTMSAKDATKDDASSADTPSQRKQKVKDYIAHHLLDSHDFGLFSYTDDATQEKHHVGFPLPIILWDNGLKVFSSSKFHHGETVAKVDGNYYKIEH